MHVHLCLFSESTGINCGDLFMSFKSIFKDIRAAVDWVHIKVTLNLWKIRIFKIVLNTLIC